MTLPTNTIALSPTEKKLWELFDFTVTDMGFRIVRVSFFKNTLQLMIEPLECSASNRVSVNVDECADVSRAVAALLDVEDVIAEKYTLEVSSTGIERPLVTAEDFTDYANNRVLIRLVAPEQGGRKHLGIVNAVTDENMVQITSDKGEALEFALSNIQSAELAPTKEDYAKLMRAV